MNVYLFVITDGPLDPQQMLAAGQLLERMGMEALVKQRLYGSEDRSGGAVEADESQSEPANGTDDEAVNYLERCFDQPPS